ncbi:Uncharacterised protein [Raoultella planticola]|uniref:Uncharacterized protein n=1 Tax=Raoultella planticola TaxID=575 RepID=A0A485BYA5_RAOPL|nr:Uncharacterised protein [Raoultella planticola]
MIAWHLNSGLLSLGLTKLQLFCVQATLQFIVLQHSINTAALFLHLSLLAASCGSISRNAKTYRAGFTHHRHGVEDRRFGLLS